MIRGIKKVAPTWYTPIAEEDEEMPTRFKLRPLTPPQLESCLVTSGSGGFSFPPSKYSEILRYGLVEWDGFTDEDDVVIECHPRNHHRIPMRIRMELAGELLVMSQLTEDDQKN